MAVVKDKTGKTHVILSEKDFIETLEDLGGSELVNALHELFAPKGESEDEDLEPVDDYSDDDSDDDALIDELLEEDK